MTDEHFDHLTVEDLLEIAAGIIDEVAVRDLGLLAAAAGRPQVTVFGDDAYPTSEDKAAALLHSLVRNQALVDGNKRLAWAATRVFCLLNGRDLAYTVDEAETLVLAAAAGDLDVPDITNWLRLRRRVTMPRLGTAVVPVNAPRTGHGECSRR
ncbi:MAG TPA: Fic family protein [Nocardioides sp.]|uniref:type II toxin-antitoxin system death-on-curing family toxin n=1 Tax=Nocardioides sp. TaxID=35761 RepID=UPI002E3443BE|nr:Fic family protein [Nocardioides sp.]HEX3931343.1 Fic family protein [Nocardioides sp.]